MRREKIGVRFARHWLEWIRHVMALRPGQSRGTRQRDNLPRRAEP